MQDAIAMVPAFLLHDGQDGARMNRVGLLPQTIKGSGPKDGEVVLEFKLKAQKFRLL